jgi:hypothetical protein
MDNSLKGEVNRIPPDDLQRFLKQSVILRIHNSKGPCFLPCSPNQLTLIKSKHLVCIRMFGSQTNNSMKNIRGSILVNTNKRSLNKGKSTNSYLMKKI